MITIVTLNVDPESQARFETLRRMHFPPERNVVPAHVTLFHALPASVGDLLEQNAAQQHSFVIKWTGVRFLGRGVAYSADAPELIALHRRLAALFDEHLNAQDRQSFRPHLVVQNKATAERARALQTELERQPLPETSWATGLNWWEYLGGSWRLLRAFEFQRTHED